MLVLLLSPLVRKVLSIFGLLVGFLVAYTLWTNHLESIGAAKEKAKEEAAAIQHEQDVVSKSTEIDQAVAKDPTPQETLQKEWSK